MTTGNDMPADDIIMADLTRAALDEVMTINEVAKVWGKARRTVEMRVWKSDLIARQVDGGKTWLVARSSVVALWGEPINGGRK